MTDSPTMEQMRAYLANTVKDQAISLKQERINPHLQASETALASAEKMPKSLDEFDDWMKPQAQDRANDLTAGQAAFATNKRANTSQDKDKEVAATSLDVGSASRA